MDRYLLPGLLLAAGLFWACEKTPAPDPAYADTEIVLDAKAVANGTKGFLDSGSLTVDGTSFQMYDYLSGYNGTISGHTNGEQFQYFSNTLTYKSDAPSWKWLFGNVSAPTSYRWTRTGTHKFFGWLLADGNNLSSLNTSGRFTYSTTITEPGVHTASVGAALTVDSPQYDFLYSDIVPVNVIADGIPAKVEVPMEHLFAALGVSIRNNSNMDVTVYGVRFINFPNSKTATVEYGDLSGNVTVGGGNPAVSGVFLPNKLTTSKTLYNKEHATEAGKIYDAITWTEIASGESPDYRLVWPIPGSALAATIQDYDTDGNPIYSSSTPLIEVDCKMGTLARRQLRIPFRSQAFEAGKKTHIMLQFMDKNVSLSYKVLPWDFEQYPMEYEDDAISSTQLKFTLNTYTDGGTERINNINHQIIRLTASSTAGSYIACGTFKIFTPVNGTLSVGLGGNADDFMVSLQSGDTTTGGTESITINPNRDGGLITLTIRPNGSPRSGSRCFLHFGVRNNGRDSDADSEINRDGFIVEIP